MMKKQTELAIEKVLNDFLMVSANDFFSDYSIKEFKNLISLVPPTYQMLMMMVSLMYDFEEIEAYEYCAVLKEKIDKNLV